MKSRRKSDRSPSRLPDSRTLELAVVGIDGFYSLHVSESLTCLCAESGGPDLGCDRGQALFRLSRASRLNKLDGDAMAA